MGPDLLSKLSAWQEPGALHSSEVGRALPTYGVPVTAEGWGSVLCDLLLAERADTLTRSAGVLASASDAAGMRTAGEEFVDLVIDFATDLRPTLAFVPARDAGVGALRECVLALAARLLQAAEDDAQPSSTAAWDESAADRALSS